MYEDLKEVLRSTAGKELKELLLSHLYRLKDIEGISDKASAADQALELKAAKKAVKTIGDILEDIDLVVVDEEQNNDSRYHS